MVENSDVVGYIDVTAGDVDVIVAASAVCSDVIFYFFVFFVCLFRSKLVVILRLNLLPLG